MYDLEKSKEFISNFIIVDFQPSLLLKVQENVAIEQRSHVQNTVIEFIKNCDQKKILIDKALRELYNSDESYYKENFSLLLKIINEITSRGMEDSYLLAVAQAIENEIQLLISSKDTVEPEYYPKQVILRITTDFDELKEQFVAKLNEKAKKKSQELKGDFIVRYLLWKDRENESEKPLEIGQFDKIIIDAHCEVSANFVTSTRQGGDPVSYEDLAFYLVKNMDFYKNPQGNIFISLIACHAGSSDTGRIEDCFAAKLTKAIYEILIEKGCANPQVIVHARTSKVEMQEGKTYTHIQKTEQERQQTDRREEKLGKKIKSLKKEFFKNFFVKINDEELMKKFDRRSTLSHQAPNSKLKFTIGKNKQVLVTDAYTNTPYVLPIKNNENNQEFDYHSSHTWGKSQLIEELEDYVAIRSFLKEEGMDNYHNISLPVIGKLSLGAPADDKINAANWLMNRLKNPQEEVALSPELKKALTTGDLYKIINSYKNNNVIPEGIAEQIWGKRNSPRLRD